MKTKESWQEVLQREQLLKSLHVQELLITPIASQKWVEAAEDPLERLDLVWFGTNINLIWTNKIRINPAQTSYFQTFCHIGRLKNVRLV